MGSALPHIPSFGEEQLQAPKALAAAPMPTPPDRSDALPTVTPEISTEPLRFATPEPRPPQVEEVPGQPANELGRIQIFMYHAFVHNPENTDEWTITFDQFREQLDWLRENDFVLVGLQSMIDRDFDIPAGKRAVVLTFDDASAGQFGLREAEGGGYEVKPDTAVGILEEYRAQYPEFVSTAFFAVLPFNCFASEDDPSTCEERLAWLVEHNYEVGNHTLGHENLTIVTDERFKKEVAEAAWWLSERTAGEYDLSDVLVLPFGAYPEADHQAAWLLDGFWHYGEYFVPSLVLEVGGGPTRSPFSESWTSNQSRSNSDPATFWGWTELVTAGEIDVFVSDGNPDVVTIPAGWEEYLNLDRIEEDGRILNVTE